MLLAEARCWERGKETSEGERRCSQTIILPFSILGKNQYSRFRGFREVRFEWRKAAPFDKTNSKGCATQMRFGLV
jgi:hypothetical protein